MNKSTLGANFLSKLELLPIQSNLQSWSNMAVKNVLIFSFQFTTNLMQRLEYVLGESNGKDVVWASVQATQPLGDRLLRPGVHGQQGLHLLAGQGQTYEPAGNCAANMLQYGQICAI